MSSHKQNGSELGENKASSLDSCTKSKNKPENLDPDHLYEAYLSECLKEMHEDDSSLDDFDSRFMEQVYKERENSDGWDRYLEILRNGLTSDDNETLCNLDPRQLNGACSSDIGHASPKSKTKDGHTNMTSQSKAEKHAKFPPKEEQKNRHYFRNGTCYYGNPMNEIKKKEKKKTTKSELHVDSSEIEFYRNLRKYFGTAKEMSERKKSQTLNLKKVSESCNSPSDKGTNSFAKDETKGKSPSSQAKPNAFSDKKVIIKEKMDNGARSDKSEGSTSQTFIKKEPSKTNFAEVYSSKCKSTKKQNFESDFASVVSEQERSKKPLLNKDTVAPQNGPYISSKVCNRDAGTAKVDDQFTSEKEHSLKKDSLTKSGKSKSDVESMHSGNPSKQSNTRGIKLGNHSKTCKAEQENLGKSSHDATKSNPFSSKKSHEQSTPSSSNLKASKSFADESSDSPMKVPISASHFDLVNNKKSQPSSKHCPSDQNFKSNYSKNETVADKGTEKSTQSSKQFSFDKDKDKKHAQRRPSFEKNEFKPQSMHEKSDKKTKKAQKTAEDKHTGSSQDSHPTTSRLHKDKKLPKQRASESSKNFESHFQKVRHGRPSKEEMIRRISPNETLESLLRHFLYTVKEIGFKCLKVLLWILYSAILITAVILLCFLKILKGTVLYAYGYVMSLGVTIAIIDKLWLVKVYLARWYGVMKEFIKDKVYGPKRAAQTYNLPNTGEDAVQQLLIRQAPDNNPYRILGVPKEATDEDIRKQYRKFAVLVHPDKNKHPQSAEAFQILSSAYDVLGDSSKRQEYDREVARKEQLHKDRASGNFMKDPSDYTNPHEFFADLMKQMEEIRESLACNVCGGRHRRRRTGRTSYHARFCSQCDTMHQAKEGDFWKESNGFLGMGPGRFYTCMESNIYDITDWGLCQERCGFHLPANSHRVCGKINSHRQQPPPRQRFTEEDIFRDIFGQNAGSGGHSNHPHREHQYRTKQQKRRRKKK